MNKRYQTMKSVLVKPLSKKLRRENNWARKMKGKQFNNQIRVRYRCTIILESVTVMVTVAVQQSFDKKLDLFFRGLSTLNANRSKHKWFCF